MSKKLYTERNARKQGQVYMDHVMAMTTEELHSKADIASELAHRDIRITELEGVLNDLLNDCINFDGEKLTDLFMIKAARALCKSENEYDRYP